MTRKDKCKVHYADCWGARSTKGEWLVKNAIATTKWQTLSPKSEFYLFIPRDERLLKNYEQFIKITDIFPVNSVGIVTARDKFVIDYNRNDLKRRIMKYRNKALSDEIFEQEFKMKDKSNWKIKNSRSEVMNDDDWEGKIQKILYRPFDFRNIFYHDAVIERSRSKVMRHMMQDNLGLITRRQMLPGHPCNYFFVSNIFISDGVIRSDNKGGESLFPLYLYPETDLLNHNNKSASKEPNIKPGILERLRAEFGKRVTPEEFFYYIYGVMYSNIYREKYAEFLKIDFPRIPFTKDYETFKQIAKLGKQLVELHLLKSKHLAKPIAKFSGDGDSKVEKLKYDETEQRVYINKTQYFEDVPKKVWEYQVGGYQVCNKWLKDRKKRVLSHEETAHYCRVVTALGKTIELQAEIDDIYPAVEKNILSMDV